MDLNLEKLELVKLLMQTESETVLRKIKEIFKNEEGNYISREQYNEVAERRAAYLNGEGNYFSYEEVKERIKGKTL